MMSGVIDGGNTLPTIRESATSHLTNIILGFIKNNTLYSSDFIIQILFK